MFTVMGITGKVGGAVAENLLATGKTVRGVVRNSGKAKAWADRGVELVQSAYDDPAGLGKAFSGAEGVFAMIPPDFAPAPGLPDQKRTIAAIRQELEQGNPGKAVFLSSIGSEQPRGLGLITSTHLMEEAMRTLPISLAYLRAGSFMENWLGALDHICATGEMPFFYAPLDRKFPLVATRDIGLAGARVLQETWTGVYKALKRFEGRSTVKTWLTRILTTQVALWRRKRRGGDLVCACKWFTRTTTHSSKAIRS